MTLKWNYLYQNIFFKVDQNFSLSDLVFHYIFICYPVNSFKNISWFGINYNEMIFKCYSLLKETKTWMISLLVCP